MIEDYFREHPPATTKEANVIGYAVLMGSLIEDTGLLLLSNL